MTSIDYVLHGDPNATFEATLPNVAGSQSNPFLLCWVSRRILYVNSGNGWVQVAQLSPDQIIQQLSEPLHTNVITKLEAEPITSELSPKFARLLRQGH